MRDGGATIDALIRRVDRMLQTARAMRRRCRETLGRAPDSVTDPAAPTRRFGIGVAWTAREVRYLKRHLASTGHEAIAKALGRTRPAVQSYARTHGLVIRRFWTDAEREIVRQHTGTLTPVAIAALLPGRTLCGVYQVQRKLGLTRSMPDLGPEFDEFIRAKHALGWGDPETVAEWNRLHPDTVDGGWGPITRECVGVRRRAMGLSHNAWHRRQRERTAAKTREQLAHAGLPSLAALHRQVIQERIAAMGWPTDIRWREAQILSLIWERGPQTKREICEALGMPFRGARGTLKNNEPGGTYLATLMRRGLLVSFPRAVRTGRRGGNVDLYSLALDIQRRRTA